MMSEDENIDDLIERVQQLESIFGDDEPDYEQIMVEFGLDINELEQEMNNFEQKMNVNYMLSDVNSVDPSYAYPTDSGFDLHSTEEFIIEPFNRKLIPTGVHIDIPDGYEIQVRSKSGLALKQGLMVLNSPGTVDSGYNSSIQVILFNTTQNEIIIQKGQKIAQAVLCPVVSGKWVNLIKVNEIKSKDRNSNGFGSTGI
jgi:dUTP pyrophosphatase